jgi:hypothetical protein
MLGGFAAKSVLFCNTKKLILPGIYVARSSCTCELFQATKRENTKNVGYARVSMWLATTKGWFSVVIDNQRPGRMLVRARCRADIFNLYNEHHETLASMEEPTSDPSRDYRWRMSVSKEDFVKLTGRLAEAVTYSNFKSAVHDRKDQQNKSSAYVKVWQTMHDVQVDENRDGSVREEAWDKFMRKVDDRPPSKPAKQKKARKRKG